MLREIVPALRIMILMTTLCGVIYPLAVTVLAQTMFPDQAKGSLIERRGRIVGSSLIGQNFTNASYFHSRPSAAGGGYDASISGGSNLGPTSQKLFDRVKEASLQFRMKNPQFTESIPSDALTASGSGLDPHISPANASAQVDRVAGARGLSAAQVRQLVARFTEGRTLGLFGEPRVNVLLLNLALDEELMSRNLP